MDKTLELIRAHKLVLEGIAQRVPLTAVPATRDDILKLLVFIESIAAELAARP